MTGLYGSLSVLRTFFCRSCGRPTLTCLMHGAVCVACGAPESQRATPEPATPEPSEQNEIEWWPNEEGC